MLSQRFYEENILLGGFSDLDLGPLGARFVLSGEDGYGRGCCQRRKSLRSVRAARGAVYWQIHSGESQLDRPKTCPGQDQ